MLTKRAVEKHINSIFMKLGLAAALGHHSPAFTLTVYAHLLEGEHAPALTLAVELAQDASVMATDALVA